MIRKILSLYRRFQYFLYGRKRKGIMKPGMLVDVEPYRFDTNFGDIVHPCVRYIQEGFEGYKWWMIYTPYYGADSKLENPILCYSESKLNIPPVKWNFYMEIQKQPEFGYNSDPNLLYEHGSLYVFWRENNTNNTKVDNVFRATYGGYVKQRKLYKFKNPILFSKDEEHDNETCPTFIVNDCSSYRAYAMDLRFHLKYIKKLPKFTRKIINFILQILKVIGVYSQQKSYGISIWESKRINDTFTYKRTVKIRKCNMLYRPWHMDFFKYENVIYSIIQTNQCNADIVLAKSENGIDFTIFTNPLITNETIQKKGIYKPTAGVTSDNLFYLYYTAQDPNNRKLNKLYLTTMNFNELKEKLE